MIGIVRVGITNKVRPVTGVFMFWPHIIENDGIFYFRYTSRLLFLAKMKEVKNEMV
jgi:hypothetical protein